MTVDEKIAALNPLLADPIELAKNRHEVSEEFYLAAMSQAMFHSDMWRVWLRVVEILADE